MADPASTTPPPMDEILASIRRIITDEPAFGVPAPIATGDADTDEDVLELGEPERAEPVAASVSAAQPTPAAASSALLSEQTQAASQRALAALSGLQIDPNADANTMDGLVREMLRPMLKDWLDAHLPEMVERLVAREVARISGR
jgi:cell pole-organizing protein PopZ